MIDIFKITGLDEFEKNLDKLQKNAARLDGTNSVPLKDLFTSSFMTKHTKFSSITEFFDATPFDSSDLDAIDDTELDIFVSQNTTFATWKDMLADASQIWVSEQLHL